MAAFPRSVQNIIIKKPAALLVPADFTILSGRKILSQIWPTAHVKCFQITEKSVLSRFEKQVSASFTSF